MKIYTKKGDDGKTALLGGARLSKANVRIEAYGTVDELNAWIGLVRDQKLGSTEKNLLLRIQHALFAIGAHLAAEPGKDKLKLPAFDESELVHLESEIDRMNEGLPEMRYFILPGGHTSISYCHVARCVCRRAERNVVALGDKEVIDSLHVKYLNRLSDLLFILSRKIATELGAPEIPWKPENKG